MKLNLTLASILGLLSVILGAFGAHALKEKISPEALHSFETAIKYLMYHSIVILFINSYSGFNETLKNRISLLFFVGILFFSGSIFAITTEILPAKSIWFITPIGGLFLISGWLIMVFSFYKSRNKNN